MNVTLVKRFNAVIMALQQAGIIFGAQRILTAPGRKSGEPRKVPIAVQQLRGHEYVWQSFPNPSWVANVRAAGTVELARGRQHRTVRFVEIPAPERRQLLLDLTSHMPKVHRDRMVTNGLATNNTPEAIAAAAQRIAVFRIDPVHTNNDAR